MRVNNRIPPFIKIFLEKMQVSAIYISAVGVCWYLFSYKFMMETLPIQSSDSFPKAMKWLIIGVVFLINTLLVFIALPLAMIMIVGLSIYIPIMAIVNIIKSFFK